MQLTGSLRVRKVLNSLIVVFWVLAQTMTAAHSHEHLPGHMMPAPDGQVALHDHAGHKAPQADAKPGCGMHAQQEAQTAANGNDGDADNCCKDIHCQSADAVKGPSSNFHVSGIDIYQVLSARHDGRSPSFSPPPPNSRS